MYDWDDLWREIFVWKKKSKQNDVVHNYRLKSTIQIKKQKRAAFN